MASMSDVTVKLSVDASDVGRLQEMLDDARARVARQQRALVVAAFAASIMGIGVSVTALLFAVRDAL